jgi:hypothetical protein
MPTMAERSNPAHGALWRKGAQKDCIFPDIKEPN